MSLSTCCLSVCHLSRDTYFKEFAHALARAVGFESVWQVSRLETQAGFLCDSLNAKFLLLWKSSIFVLKPIHIIWGNLLLQIN